MRSNTDKNKIRKLFETNIWKNISTFTIDLTIGQLDM